MYNSKLKPPLSAILVVLLTLLVSCTQQEKELSPEEARAIAKEAYIYGNPVVDSYRILHSYFVDTKHPDFKAAWNEIKNIPRVYTHEDMAVQTPNSDAPYSWLALDLRTEPVVLTVPPLYEPLELKTKT